MAGRPPLRIGAHGKITRQDLGGGVWIARCKYRDTDGVTRRVERQGPVGDKRGKLAEDALIEALSNRQAPGVDVDVSLDTTVMSLVERHIERLEEDGRSPATLSTYETAAGKLLKFLGKVRVREATPARLDTALRGMREAHGLTMAKQARTILRGGLQLAIRANTITTNPVNDLEEMRAKAKPRGAAALTSRQLRELLDRLQAHAYCQELDLADPFTLLIATGVRPSELLAWEWPNFHEDVRELEIAGKVVRAKGRGLQRIDEAKSESGLRTVPLPQFAIDCLKARRERPYVGEQKTIFASTTGTLRDPNNMRKQWRKVRDELGFPEVTAYSFRKTVATLIDEERMPVRVAADQLGHANVSMTQDRYQARKRVHHEVAAMLDRVVASPGNSDE